MTIPPIKQNEIDAVKVTREGDKLRAVAGDIKERANVVDNPSELRTRAVLLLALANYIDNPPLPPFDFPTNHAAVILADTPMVEAVVNTARFTRIENSGWFSAKYGWQTEETLLKNWENLRVVSPGVEGYDPEFPPMPTDPGAPVDPEPVEPVDPVEPADPVEEDPSSDVPILPGTDTPTEPPAEEEPAPEPPNEDGEAEQAVTE